VTRWLYSIFLYTVEMRRGEDCACGPPKPGEITSVGAIFSCGRSREYVRLWSLGLSCRFLSEIVGQQPAEYLFPALKPCVSDSFFALSNDHVPQWKFARMGTARQVSTFRLEIVVVEEDSGVCGRGFSSRGSVTRSIHRVGYVSLSVLDKAG
jgi:hypothetical protein